MKVSICIPTYNRKDYIFQTLDSVFNQSFKDYEVIIVDDGSTDGTEAAVKEKYPTVKYHWKENGGDASARNKLISLAKGDFITFIDSDDLLFPDTVERLYNSIKETKDSCAYGQHIRIDEDSIETPTKLKVLPSGNITIPLFQHILVHSCGSMFPLNALKEIGGFNETIKVCSDYSIWLRLSLKYKFIAQEKPTFKRRRHSGNLSALTYDNLLIELNVLKDFYENFAKTIIPANSANARLAKEYYRVAMCAAREDISSDIIKDLFKQSLNYKFSFKVFLKSLIF